MSTTPANGNGNGSAPAPAFPDHPNWAGPQRFAALAAIIGLVVYVVAGFVHLGSAGESHAKAAQSQFFISWLVAWVFWLSMPVGGMALLCIHYLVKTSWGILLKRFFEAATRTLPLMLLFFLPIVGAVFMESVEIYQWTNPAKNFSGEALEEFNYRLEGTFHFLTPTGFAVVTGVVFAFWFALTFFQNKWSRDMDDPAVVVGTLEKLKNISGPGLIGFALIGTASITMWVMSLEPAWASTMFPVIYSVNQLLCALAFSLACFLTLAQRPPLKDILRPKFQIDMGTLLLALTLFWSYTSFSQMMLIWAGNLPEEIPFFLKRSVPTYGFWWWISAGLIFLHFILPFLLLLFRDVKKDVRRLRAVAIYILVICAVDVIWWIEPTFLHADLPLFWVMDFGAIAGLGGLWGLVFIYQLKKRSLIASNETFWLPVGHEGHDHGSH